MHISLSRALNDEWSRNLNSFIEQCQNLRHLVITGATGEVLMPSQVLPNENWINLRTMALGNVSLAEDDLINFTDRHQTTLSAIALHDCPLVTGKWASVVIRLKQIFPEHEPVGEYETVSLLEHGLIPFRLFRFRK